jgi:predicted outer membrane repeat protein
VVNSLVLANTATGSGGGIQSDGVRTSILNS